MTEAEWLTCEDALQMLHLLRGRARKLRLVAVACCRHSLQCMADMHCRKAVEVAELFADGLANEEQLSAARQDVDPEWGESTAFAAWASDRPAQTELIFRVQRSTWVDHCSLLRDIFGNPFVSETADPTWLAWNNSTVAKLAQAIYAERGFDRMPILADALEDGGCTSHGILSHCRQPGDAGLWTCCLARSSRHDRGRMAGLS